MAYSLGGYCWVDMSKSMQTSDLTPVTTAIYYRSKNMDTELREDIINSFKLIKKVVLENLDNEDNAKEGLSTYMALNIIDMVVTNHIQLLELSAERRNDSRM